jgi:hypothetical protein
MRTSPGQDGAPEPANSPGKILRIRHLRGEGAGDMASKIGAAQLTPSRAAETVALSGAVIVRSQNWYIFNATAQLISLRIT